MLTTNLGISDRFINGQFGYIYDFYSKYVV